MEKINRLRPYWAGIAVALVLIVIVITLALKNYYSSSAKESIEVKQETVQTANDKAKEDPPTQIAVHVAGNVKNPGLYVLQLGARVNDAILAAGGALPEADTDSINLAAPLIDGKQLYVPSKDAQPGEGDETEMAKVSPEYLPDRLKPEKETTKASGKAVGIVNINTADKAELDTLPGVGPVTADRILNYRNTNGKFKTVDDLLKVSGIGKKTLEKLLPYITV